ncbi:MAG: hypothetical protein V2I33_12050 [Kangiellaceae bacterium]|jgi:hypothetical protein|nr:hypothetical protein [Kangiellaceae bacterium]
MNRTLKLILAIIAGLVVGSIVNMSLIMIGPSLIPPPSGVNVQDPDSIAQSIHLFEFKHFITPWLAHALGTLIGSALALLIADKRVVAAYGVGGLFLLGGVMAATMIPAPMWFLAADLILAYIPMALLAIVLVNKIAGK